MPHDEATKEKIAQGQKRHQARKRGELVIVEQPSMEELQVEFAHTWADVRFRLTRMCDVAEKCYDEIMGSDRTPTRLVEVFNQTLDGIAKEVGARQIKTQVEHSGSIDVTGAQERLLQRLTDIGVPPTDNPLQAS